MREGGNLFAFHLGLLGFGQHGNSATGVQHFGLEGHIVRQGLDFGAQLLAHFIEAQLEQLHKACLLGFVLEDF